MVSTRTLISKSCDPCINPLVIVPRAPFTVGITVTFMFLSFFSSWVRSTYLSFFSLFFSVLHCGQVERQSPLLAGSLLLLIITKPGHLAKIRWSVCISKSQRFLCISFSWMDSGLCINHLFVWSKLKFLYNSQSITLLTQSCLVLYSFCPNLLHLVIMWLIVSSLLPHYLHLLFCCVLSVLV